MDRADKIKVFAEEIRIIRPEFREQAENCVAELPDYFFSIPAASTGKYHPAYALGDGGLSRHVKGMFRIMVSLFPLMGLPKDEEDLLLIATLVHDGWKNGLDPNHKFTVTEHPLIAADKVRSMTFFATVDHKEFVASVVATHMGQWTQGVLSKPTGKAQSFLHWCDYLASRKFLTVDFSLPIERR